MEKKSFNKIISTNDLIIRSALKKDLEYRHAQDEQVRIIEELGVRHGTARIDIVVVNGIMHGYEIKSDRDTLERLPEQMIEFNAIFDRITLIVGKQHLYRAIHIVPDWWGITIAKINTKGRVIFQTIREPEDNKKQDKVSTARLLWREEALQILEKNSEANGFYSKPRDLIYKKLAAVLDQKTLNEKVREMIFLRTDWRPDAQPILNGG